MTQLQTLFEKTVATETSSARLLARLVATKLANAGVSGALSHLDAFERAIAQRLAVTGIQDFLNFEFETGDPILDASNHSISINVDDIERMSNHLQEAIESAVTTLTEEMARAKLQSVKSMAAGNLKAREDEASDFRQQLAARWEKPLHLLALQITLTLEIGGEANTWLRKHRREHGAAVVEAVTRLHARACQVAAEVEALLRGGFADGALSRWRTLHELAIVAWFIQEKGDEVAQRYLDHLTIDSLRMARLYSASASALGHRQISDREMETLRAKAKNLELQHGPAFRTDYGWAAAVLSNPRPSFADIEKAVDFEKMRPYYKLASDTVHAGPKGAYFRIGMLEGASGVLLAGASNAGLDEPGRLTAMSLAQITIPLLLIRPSLDALVWSRVVMDLSREVEQAFIAEQARLEIDERRHQDRLRQRKVPRLRLMPRQRRV